MDAVVINNVSSIDFLSYSGTSCMHVPCLISLTPCMFMSVKLSLLGQAGHACKDLVTF